MTSFGHHLQLEIKEYLCPFNNSFPGIEMISNEEPLSGMSKYIMFSLTMVFVRFGNDNLC